MTVRYHMVTLAHVQVRGSDFSVHISMCMNTQRMHIFKYNDVCCDYDVFEVQEEATAFIEKPMPRAPKSK